VKLAVSLGLAVLPILVAIYFLIKPLQRKRSELEEAWEAVDKLLEQDSPYGSAAGGIPYSDCKYVGGASRIPVGYGVTGGGAGSPYPFSGGGASSTYRDFPGGGGASYVDNPRQSCHHS